MIKNCKYCGKEFVQHKQGRKKEYCSGDCQYRNSKYRKSLFNKRGKLLDKNYVIDYTSYVTK